MSENKKITTEPPGNSSVNDPFGDPPSQEKSNSFGMSTKALNKPSPDNLREEINTTTSKTGATIAIVSTNPRTRGALSHMTNKFYLSNMQVPYQEKAQVLETFGASAVSFLGQRATVYSFSGLAIDWPSGGDFPYTTMQGSSLIKLYQEHLRGTRLVKTDRIAVMRVMNHLIYGYPLSLQTGINAGSDKTQSFSMSWVVTDHSLAMPGVFNEEDLEKNYLPGYNNPEHAELLQLIDKFLEKYRELMIITISLPNGDEDEIILSESTPVQLYKRANFGEGAEKFTSKLEQKISQLLELLSPDNTDQFKELTSSITAKNTISTKVIDEAKSSGGVGTVLEIDSYYKLIIAGKHFADILIRVKQNILSN